MDQEPGQHPGADRAPGAPRPAPPGYGAAVGGSRRPDVSASTPADAVPADHGSAGGTTVYGRVTRFGGEQPGRPPAAATPSAPGTWAPPGAWPPPGPWPSPGPVGPAGPPSSGSPGPPPGWPHAAYGPAPDGGAAWGGAPGPGPGSAPWAAPSPWFAPPPRPTWRREDYARWLRRVGATLLDQAPAYVAQVLVLVSYVPLYVGLLRGDLGARPTWWLLVVGILLSLAALGWDVYNRWFLAGRTGQSFGKRVTRTWLVGAADGRPVGMLNAFLRDLLHVLDGMAYVGYLWPLWDERRQTFADKVIDTVVVRTPVAPLEEHERARRL